MSLKVDEKDEMSIKDAAEAIVEAMDFKGEVIVILKIKFTLLLKVNQSFIFINFTITLKV